MRKLTLLLALTLGACAHAPHVRYLDVTAQHDDETVVTRPSAGGCDTDDTCEPESADPYATASACVGW